MSLNGTKLLSLRGFNGNKELNLFCASRFIRAIGSELIGLFVPIYLYGLGYPVYSIILFYWLWAFYFVVFSCLGARIISKIGLKRAMLFSAVFKIVYLLGLRYIAGSTFLFWFLPFVHSCTGLFDVFAYHLIFLRNSEVFNRGKQLSFIRAMVMLAGIITPAIGGYLIFYYNFNLLYAVGAMITLISTIPLFLTKEVYEKMHFTYKALFREIVARRNVHITVSYSGYAIEFLVGWVIWPVFMFVILGTTKETGLAVTISTIAAFLVLFIVGKLTDGWDKLKLLKIGTLLYCLGWLGRIFATSYSRIIYTSSFKKLAEKVLHIPWSTFSYDIASKRKDGFLFFVYKEVVFKLSRVIVLPFIMLLFYFKPDAFKISFIIAAAFSLGYIALTKEVKFSKRKLRGKLLA